MLETSDNDSQRDAIQWARARNRIISEMVLRLGHLTHCDAELERRLERLPAGRALHIRALCQTASDGLAESLADWLQADGRSAFVPAPIAFVAEPGVEATLPPFIVRDAADRPASDPLPPTPKPSPDSTTHK